MVKASNAALWTYRDNYCIRSATDCQTECPLHGEVKVGGLNNHIPRARGHLGIHEIAVAVSASSQVASRATWVPYHSDTCSSLSGFDSIVEHA